MMQMVFDFKGVWSAAEMDEPCFQRRNGVDYTQEGGSWLVYSFSVRALWKADAVSIPIAFFLPWPLWGSLCLQRTIRKGQEFCSLDMWQLFPAPAVS